MISAFRAEDLMRHLEDLRTRSYEGRVARVQRVELFRSAMSLLEPIVVRVLEEVNAVFLDGTGEIVFSDPGSDPDDDLDLRWTLSWPDQRRAANVRAPGPVGPVTVVGSFLATFNHPHLRGSKAGSWPLQVLNEEDAARQEPIIRAIVEAELHERIFEGTWRIVPSFVRRSGPG